MKKNLDEISDEVFDTILNTDLGQDRLERERAAERARIFLRLCQVMPEVQARTITDYTGK